MFYIIAFLAGVSIVLNMVYNGKVAQETGMINGLLVTYGGSILFAIVLCLITMPSLNSLTQVPLVFFLGGFMGVLTTFIFNLILPQLPAGYVVVLRFIGQMLASALIDYLYFEVFSIGKIIGALLFLIGLWINTNADQVKASRQP